MTVSDPALEDMVRQLAAMPSFDRDYVVGQLGDDEARLLAPYLDLVTAWPLSSRLRSLAKQCREGRVPDDIRPRASAALLTAVASAGQDGEPAEVQRPVARTSLRARAAEFLGGR